MHTKQIPSTCYYTNLVAALCLLNTQTFDELTIYGGTSNPGIMMLNAAPDLSFLLSEVLYPVFGYMSPCTRKNKKFNNQRERERERERADYL